MYIHINYTRITFVSISMTTITIGNNAGFIRLIDSRSLATEYESILMSPEQISTCAPLAPPALYTSNPRPVYL